MLFNEAELLVIATVSIGKDDLPSPKDIQITRVSGEPWIVDNQINANLDGLKRLIDDRSYNTRCADWNLTSLDSCQVQWIITNNQSEPEVVCTLAELVKKIDWSMPNATVVFMDWTYESYHYNHPQICYQSWYEYLGYASICTPYSIRYVKHTDIPIGWLPDENMIWCPPLRISSE